MLLETSVTRTTQASETTPMRGGRYNGALMIGVVSRGRHAMHGLDLSRQCPGRGMHVRDLLSTAFLLNEIIACPNFNWTIACSLILRGMLRSRQCPMADRSGELPCGRSSLGNWLGTGTLPCLSQSFFRSGLQALSHCGMHGALCITPLRIRHIGAEQVGHELEQIRLDLGAGAQHALLS